MKSTRGEQCLSISVKTSLAQKGVRRIRRFSTSRDSSAVTSPRLATPSDMIPPPFRTIVENSVERLWKAASPALG